MTNENKHTNPEAIETLKAMIKDLEIAVRNLTELVQENRGG